MATPEDLRANADYIRMADQYVEVGKDSSRCGLFIQVSLLRETG
jgi:hypothetical protein